MPGDARQYSTRDVVLKKGPEEFRTPGQDKDRVDESNSNTTADNNNTNNNSNVINNSGNSGSSSNYNGNNGKGHYGHRESETNHLRSITTIHENRRASDENSQAVGYNKNSSSSNNNNSNSKNHYDNMTRENGVVAPLNKNGSADGQTKAVAVYERSFNKPVKGEKVSNQLRDAIHNHLDPLLYNKPRVTDLGQVIRPSDAQRLANILLIRLGGCLKYYL
ncbi:hypothetical protein EGW08_011018 [Elysia chlorotica]|uniref:Uncharacterized protein n=1 Tax=Elysia chlorotica TaxID=188477 RepID=A0A433TI15_ELYCH|nr:hypothetical protein EGW08_011018 [Elysia chlorotica]